MIPISLATLAVTITLVLVFTRKPGPPPGDPPMFNVELRPPDHLFELACPHCAYMIALDDLSVVGDSLGCPQCEGMFLVLEPEREKVHG